MATRPSFAELDYQRTPLGELILRMRHSPALGDTPVYEVKLDGAFLMSSVVTDSEIALADLALRAWGEAPCEVLIGGLGLGYTAVAALRHATVRRVSVMEYLEPVIRWHRDRMIPAADALMDDPRCELIHGDFFRHITDSDARYDVILLDIDHSPEACLHADHESFYAPAGLKRLTRRLTPAGVFALWSARAPEAAFTERLGEAFDTVDTHKVTYHHPMLHRAETNTVIVARGPRT